MRLILNFGEEARFLLSGDFNDDFLMPVRTEFLLLVTVVTIEDYAVIYSAKGPKDLNF